MVELPNKGPIFLLLQQTLQNNLSESLCLPLAVPVILFPLYRVFLALVVGPNYEGALYGPTAQSH